MSQNTEILSDTPKFFKLQKRVLASYYKRECVICYDGLADKNITLFTCGHLCCFTCAIQLQQNSKFQCPLCRKELRSPRNAVVETTIEDDDEEEEVQHTYEVRGGYEIGMKSLIGNIDGETQFTSFHSAVRHLQLIKSSNHYRVLCLYDLEEGRAPRSLGEWYWINPNEILKSMYCVRGKEEGDMEEWEYMASNDFDEANRYYNVLKTQNEYVVLYIVENKPECLSSTNPQINQYWTKVALNGECLLCNKTNPPNICQVEGEEYCIESCVKVCCKCLQLFPISTVCEHYVCRCCITQRLCIDCVE